MKKAIIIGASSGIGYELAKILFRNNYAVGVAARRVHLLEELRNSTGHDLCIELMDVSDVNTVEETLKNLIEKMGGMDLLVISAGTGYINDELEWALEDDTIKTNVAGFSAMVNVALKYFIQKGAGHLVGISSIAALRGGRQAPAYNASKAFQSNYLEGMRQKVRKLGLPITITDVKPGYVKTAMAKGYNIFWAAEADKAAMQIYEAVRRKKSNVYITRRWRLIAWLIKSLPRCIYEKL